MPPSQLDATSPEGLEEDNDDLKPYGGPEHSNFVCLFYPQNMACIEPCVCVCVCVDGGGERVVGVYFVCLGVYVSSVSVSVYVCVYICLCV